MSQSNQSVPWADSIAEPTASERSLGRFGRHQINPSLRRKMRDMVRRLEDQQTDLIEHRSGAIIPRNKKLLGTEQWCYSVDSNTYAGLMKFIGVPRYFAGDPQSDNRPASSRARLFLLHGGHEQSQLTAASPTGSENLAPLSTEAILTILQNPGTPSALRRAVLGAEVVKFTPEEASEVCELLRRYITTHCSITDHDTEVAVASAVRTYVVLLPASELDEIAELLDAPTALPQQFESEVTKMVVRKLTAVPPDRDDQFSALASQLIGLASAYLHPRLLTRPYYGAIVLNSVLALALLRTQQWQEIAQWVRKLNAGWFRQQLGRRAGRIVSELSIRFQRSRAQSQLDTLQALVDMSKV